VTPQHTRLVEALLSCPFHLIGTIRSKMAYEVDTDPKTKKVTVRKLGLQPLQREGMEYEFDIFGDLDVDNTLSISKTRNSALSGYAVQKAGEELGILLWEWAQGDAAPEKPAEAPQPAQPAAASSQSNGAKPDVWASSDATKAFLELLGNDGFSTTQLAKVVTQRSAQGGIDIAAWRKANPDKGPRSLISLVADYVRSQETPPAPEEAAMPQESPATPPDDGECEKGGQHEPAMDNAGDYVCAKCSAFLASADAPGDVKQEALLRN
jgi:hypothetical protein